MSSQTPTIKKKFLATFGHDAAGIATAPGRVNLIGEHTDYNEGLVLPLAIDRKVQIWLSPRSDSIVNLAAENFGQTDRFDLSQPIVKGAASWSNYIKGIAGVLLDAGYSLKGMDALVYGDIPVASGLSSSAALEVASILALLSVAELPLPTPLEIAKLAQKSEHEFIGVHCGLMDQYISAAAQADCALKIDCRTMEATPVSIPENLAIVVADTGLSRTLAGSAYNQRRQECEEAFALIKANLSPVAVESMRDLSVEVVEQSRTFLPDKLLRRVLHVAHENLRVESAVTALANGTNADLEQLGALLNQSHASLRDNYEVSSPGLDTVTEILRDIPGCPGARLTGAGFGGCAVAVVLAQQLDDFLVNARRAVCELDPCPVIFPVVPQAGGKLLTSASS